MPKQSKPIAGIKTRLNHHDVALGAIAALFAVIVGVTVLTVSHAAPDLPPGPPPTNFGPYGGYGLWDGTCSSTGGLYGYGEISTHWDQYRGKAVVQYLEIAAAFSATSTPKTPIPGKTYTNIQNVDHPTWGKPIPVGGRHQDGPLYLQFRQPTAHSVIAVSFYWLDANKHVLWHSPTPLLWRC